jgi:hypothetical protein
MQLVYSSNVNQGCPYSLMWSRRRDGACKPERRLLSWPRDESVECQLVPPQGAAQWARQESAIARYGGYRCRSSQFGSREG